MATRSRSIAPTAKVTSPNRRSSGVAKSKSATKTTARPEVRIFVSYSHQDTGAKTKLNTHLAPWRRDAVKVWYDENIDPGAALNIEIARELRRAHIFVALFSPAYLDSNYCWNIEYKRAMGRRARGQMRVVGVVVKPCAWKQTPAANFKLLPRDGVPPERWSSHDAAYVNVAEGIGDVIKTVRREIALTPPKPARAAAESRTPKSKLGALRKVEAAANAKSAKPRTSALRPSTRKRT